MSLAPPSEPTPADLLRSYQAIQRRLLRDLDRLTRWIAAEQKAGRPVPQWRLLRQQRFRDLLTQTATEMNKHAAVVEAVTIQEAQAASDQARTEAVTAIQRSMGPAPAGVSLNFNQLPRGAVDELTASLAPGAPLRELLDNFGVDAAAAVRTALLEGVALGLAPRATAAAVRRALGVSAVRAMTIVRTEQLRAFRNSSLKTYQANADVVKGWRWRCARQTRTCAMCWAMDGQEFGLDDTLDSHPNCRCSMQPITKSWAELGIQGVPDLPTPEPGAAVFARLSEAEQREVLGAGKHDLYAAGEIALRDLVAVTQSRVWGKGRRERALKEVRP